MPDSVANTLTPTPLRATLGSDLTRPKKKKERIRQIPTKLCQLAWTEDPDSWGFVFYKYSDNRYEPSIMLDNSFASPPESCSDTAAQLYLQ